MVYQPRPGFSGNPFGFVWPGVRAKPKRLGAEDGKSRPKNLFGKLREIYQEDDTCNDPVPAPWPEAVLFDDADEEFNS